MADNKDRNGVRKAIDKSLDDSDEARARRGQQSHEADRFMGNATVSSIAAMLGAAATKKLYKKVVKPTHSFKEQNRVANLAAGSAGITTGGIAGMSHYHATKDKRRK